MTTQRRESTMKWRKERFQDGGLEGGGLGVMQPQAKGHWQPPEA